MTKFIVQTATAKMPRGVKARYRKVAVLEVDDNMERAAMISTRARGVHRIIYWNDRLHAGTNGGNTAYDRALREATEMAALANRGIFAYEIDPALDA